MILRIDSPGGRRSRLRGALCGGAQAFREEARGRGDGQVAASGGYMTALGADWIVARGNTITGSIGVICSRGSRELLQKLGIQMEQLKSGQLKAEPNPFKPLTERPAPLRRSSGRLRRFIGLVAERRKMPGRACASFRRPRLYRAPGGSRRADRRARRRGKGVAWLETEGSWPRAFPSSYWEPESSSKPNGAGLCRG